ncbi:MAG: UDP-N-acetylmuramoyl-L-alanine--D-glutamate ligase, partial [Saprospiraceae bacterium]
MKQRISILGAAESGIGAAILAQKLGMEILVSDASAIAPKFKAILLENGIPFEENGHTLDNIVAADFVVKSPGIPENASIVNQIREQGIEIIS